MFRAAGCACTGKQQPQIIVNFSHSAHSGTRVVAGGFLFNGNGGGQPLDQIHIGFFHQLQELAGVCRQTFHVTALAFGIQSVECQAGFARARQPGQHHKRVAGQVERNVFQVVGSSATNAYGVHAVQQMESAANLIL